MASMTNGSSRQSATAAAVEYLLRLRPGDEVSHEDLARICDRDLRIDTGLVGTIRKRLADHGVWLESIKGKGYRIPKPGEYPDIMLRESDKAGRFHERKLNLWKKLADSFDESVLSRDERASFAAATMVVLNKLPELQALNRSDRVRRELAIEALHNSQPLEVR